jgi:hypothetical protein
MVAQIYLSADNIHETTVLIKKFLFQVVRNGPLPLLFKVEKYSN